MTCTLRHTTFKFDDPNNISPVFYDPRNSHRIVLDLLTDNEHVDRDGTVRAKPPTRYRVDRDGIHIHGAGTVPATPAQFAGHLQPEPVITDLTVNEGDLVAFTVTAVATRAVFRRLRHGRNQRGQRVTITGHNELAEWLNNTMTVNGRVYRNPYQTSEPATTPPLGSDLTITSMGTDVVGSLTGDEYWQPTIFAGTVRVNHLESFQDFHGYGIGKSTAFGFGVPHIRPTTT